VNYTFSLAFFNVFLNKNQGCNNKMPPMQYVILGPTDQYTKVQIKKLNQIKLKLKKKS